jgi:xylan 1,4-beta-xylosidase
MKTYDFACDISGPAEAFPHFWEHTVGSGHATLALRADWQKQLKRCREELGFRHVRFHGILSDDVGTLMCEMDKLVYSFFNADQICDFLLSIDMKPFMELSFMPSALSSGGDSVFHYKANITPPRDTAAWATLIQKLVQHWSDRYGSEEVKKWFFEIWNEPNLKAFWTGTQAEYFRLYEVSAQAIKAVNSDFKVGGPATANNGWIPEFTTYCKDHKVPLDFISTHHYPTDAFGKPGDDTEAQLAASHRSVLREQATLAKKEAQDKPLYYTEWSTSSNPFDELHDLPYAAAYITKTVMEQRGLVQAYSYWIFSDIFEENYFSSIPFHGGFGLMNIYGIPKPAYRAYELLHQLGNEILPTEGKHETIDLWVTREKGKIKLLLTNSALPRHPVKVETIRIQLNGIRKIKTSTITRIDNNHANATQGWKDLKSPGSLSPTQVEKLENQSRLVAESFPVRLDSGQALIEVVLPVQGTACITLEIE